MLSLTLAGQIISDTERSKQNTEERNNTTMCSGPSSDPLEGVKSKLEKPGGAGAGRRRVFSK